MWFWMRFPLPLSLFYTASELEEAVSRSEKQEECTVACERVCTRTRVEGGAGFSVGRYCSGECDTDPWMLLTQTVVFYFIYCSWQRHCLGNHDASPLLTGAFCVIWVGHSKAAEGARQLLFGSRRLEIDSAS